MEIIGLELNPFSRMLQRMRVTLVEPLLRPSEQASLRGATQIKILRAASRH